MNDDLCKSFNMAINFPMSLAALYSNFYINPRDPRHLWAEMQIQDMKFTLNIYRKDGNQCVATAEDVEVDTSDSISTSMIPAGIGAKVPGVASSCRSDNELSFTYYICLDSVIMDEAKRCGYLSPSQFHINYMPFKRTRDDAIQAYKKEFDVTGSSGSNGRKLTVIIMVPDQNISVCVGHSEA